MAWNYVVTYPRLAVVTAECARHHVDSAPVVLALPFRLVCVNHAANH
jgi:hypothetical protein